MSLFEERLADLPLTIEGYALERLERDVSSAFTRVSTAIRMHGGGEEGVGEDVTYDAEDHDALQATSAVLPLAGGDAPIHGWPTSRPSPSPSGW
jgi:hypothetical protein